ncbi:MAG: hypothetical protein KBG15_17780 [Kofleriaceae bacterium]|nr:hypothetical protein [Kofleriaceae bacterium]
MNQSSVFWQKLGKLVSQKNLPDYIQTSETDVVSHVANCKVFGSDESSDGGVQAPIAEALHELGGGRGPVHVLTAHSPPTPEASTSEDDADADDREKVAIAPVGKSQHRPIVALSSVNA